MGFWLAGCLQEVVTQGGSIVLFSMLRNIGMTLALHLVTVVVILYFHIKCSLLFLCFVVTSLGDTYDCPIIK